MSIEVNPFSGGGGGGAVDSVNGMTGVVVITKSNVGLGNVNNTSDANKPVSTAQQAAIDLQGQPVGGTAGQVLAKIDGTNYNSQWVTPSVTPTGTADRFALFDSGGNLSDLAGFAYNSFQGENFVATVAPTNAGDYQTLHNHYLALNPSVADADQNWHMHFYEMSAGDDNSGNQVGDAANGSMTGIGVSVRSIQTSNVGNMSMMTGYLSLGNGTDPLTGRNLNGYYASMNAALGGITVENVTGYEFNLNLQAGSEVSNQLIGFRVAGGADKVSGGSFGYIFSPQLPDVAGINAFTASPSYTDASQTIITFSDFSQQASGLLANNYFSVTLQPSINDITGGYWGVNIAPTIADCDYADGISVNMDNVTSGGQVRAGYFKGDVQIDGALSFSGSLSIGQLSSFSNYTVVDGGGNPGTNNGLITAMAATGVVANCDSIGLNTACLITMDATFQGTSGGFGLGLASLALPNVISMAAGCSLDNLASCVYANTFDAGNTGGTIDRLIGARSVNIPGGGTQTVTRAYNFFADYFAGDIAVDSWGLYDSGAKYNWMANALKIGTGDTTSYNFEVTGDSKFDGQVGFYGTNPVAQPTSSGVATAGAVYTATEQAMLQEAYDALRALGLMS